MKLAQSLFTAAFIIVAAGCTATTSDSGDAASSGDTASGGDTGSGGGDTGTGGDTGGDTSTVSDTSGETGGDCKSCAAANCKSESDACGADSKCVDGVVCLAKCQSSDAGAADKSTCENTCITNANNDHLNAYVACLSSKCKTPCGL